MTRLVSGFHIVSTPPSLGSAQGAHALLVEQQGMTDPVAIEIARLLGNGLEQEGLIPALAMKFPDLRPAEFDEALRDVIALQNLVAAELAECQRELTQLKVELQRYENLTYYLNSCEKS